MLWPTKTGILGTPLLNLLFDIHKDLPESLWEWIACTTEVLPKYRYHSPPAIFTDSTKRILFLCSQAPEQRGRSHPYSHLSKLQQINAFLLKNLGFHEVITEKSILLPHIGDYTYEFFSSKIVTRSSLLGYEAAIQIKNRNSGSTILHGDKTLLSAISWCLRLHNTATEALLTPIKRTEPILGEVIQDSKYGTLCRFPHLEGANQHVYAICVEDSTDHSHHWIQVPPGMKTVKEAVAWTFSLKEEDYAPLIET